MRPRICPSVSWPNPTMHIIRRIKIKNKEKEKPTAHINIFYFEAYNNL